MSHCLLQIHQCSFANCGLHFANQYDLIAHVEYTHIPMIEDEMKRKTLSGNGNTEEKERTSTAPPNMPLSIMSRVFRTAYRPNPVKSEPLKVSFNHYKKRAIRERYLQQQAQLQQMRVAQVEEGGKKLCEVDLDECLPGDPEIRFRCQAVDCTKRYKSMFALRVHMKTAHSMIIGDDMKHYIGTGPNFDDHRAPAQLHPQNSNQVQQNNPTPNQLQIQGSNVHQSEKNSQYNTPNSVHNIGQSVSMTLSSSGPVPGIHSGISSSSKPHKCSYCSKRYKTPTGLSNHLVQAHQKTANGSDSPSPAVVEQLITQARMQRQQQEQQGISNGQVSSTKSLGVAQSQSQQAAAAAPVSHVRSFTVTTTSQPLRFTQNHIPATLAQPTTGQLLQMQMQQQKRQLQLQQQQQQHAVSQSQHGNMSQMNQNLAVSSSAGSSHYSVQQQGPRTLQVHTAQPHTTHIQMNSGQRSMEQSYKIVNTSNLSNSNQNSQSGQHVQTTYNM